MGLSDENPFFPKVQVRLGVVHEGVRETDDNDTMTSTQWWRFLLMRGAKHRNWSRKKNVGKNS